MSKKFPKSAQILKIVLKKCQKLWTVTSKLFVNMSIFTEVINNLFCVVLFDRLLRNIDRIFKQHIKGFCGL